MTKDIIDMDPYKSSGVDIEAGNNLVKKIKDDVASTHNSNVLENIGGFAGMYELSNDFKEPVLVSCTDGVGTKVALAQEHNDLSKIGQDLVAMCVNDLIVCGAKPLFFLDYYATSKLNENEASIVIKSIVKCFIYNYVIYNENINLYIYFINIIIFNLFYNTSITKRAV